MPVSDASRATVLIIDDNLINRKKMRLAVMSLGYNGYVAKDGLSGLKALRNQSYDAVLLDMLMPGIDGFEVLRRIKSDEQLRELPVIVISDLEGDTQSVSSAIEMGAEDFLPKDFDPVLLDSRLKACLRRKHYRDQELDYFRRINALTDAAERVEAGWFDAENLNLADEARIEDPIGRLALVFQGMAREIHLREVKLLHRIRTLHCSILLLICGAGAGLTPSLSRMSAGLGSNPIGLAVWVDLIATILCLGLVLLRGGFPKLSRDDIAFFVGWAFVVGIVQHISIFVLASHVEATFLTLVLGLEGLIVFCIAAILRLEKTASKRVFGLLIGLAGLGVSVVERMSGSDIQANFWLFAALLVPFIFAFETVVVSVKLPKHIDPIEAICIMFAFSTVLAFGLAGVTGNIMPASSLRSPLGLVIALLAVGTVVANVTFVLLLKLGGGVFTSQTAYVTAIAGVVWGIVLLGESVSPLAWIAIGLVLIGMYMVGSKPSDDPVAIKRNFVGQSNE